MTLLVNLAEMARTLDVSLPTMRDLLVRHPDFPVVQRGGTGAIWQFDPVAVIEFMTARREEEAAAEAARSEQLAQLSFGGADLTPEGERNFSAADRLKNANAMLKEDELRKQRGFLVQTSDMRQRLTAAWTPLTQALNALPSAIGRQHNLPEAVIRDMRRYMHGQQTQLRDRLRDLLADDVPETGEDDAPEAA
jgi:phage terminase Nu1 subunit (DNA packaging protein)